MTTAVFRGVESVLGGNWIGAYGAEGYGLVNNATSYPTYATVSVDGVAHTWADTTDVRALLTPDGASRIAACWYSPTSFTIDVNLTDDAVHRVALYALDWDAIARTERIDVIDAATSAVLDTRAVSGFQGGQYLVWNLSGHVLLRITNTSTVNAVISGVFFDDATATGAPLVYASTVCVLDATSGASGTDVTASLQAVLDTAHAAAPVHLVIDGNALVSGLDLGSYTTVELVEGANLWLKDGSNRAVLRNKHRMRQIDGAVVDTHIRLILAGTVQGNGANQVGVGTWNTQEPDGLGGAPGTFIAGVQLFGVDYVRIDCARLAHLRSIAVHIGYSSHGTIGVLSIENNDGRLSQGGLQFDGACSDWQVEAVTGCAFDDLTAVCTDSEGVFGGTADLGPYVGGGDMVDIHIAKVASVAGSISLFRMASKTSLIDRCTWGEVSGMASQWAGIIDTSGSGGNLGRVAVEHINVALAMFDIGQTPYLVYINTVADHIRLGFDAVECPLDGRKFIHVTAPSVIALLELDGYSIRETKSATAGMLPVNIEGTVSRFHGRGLTWRRDAALVEAPAFLTIAPGASVPLVMLDGVDVERVAHLVRYSENAAEALISHVYHQPASGNTTVHVDGGKTLAKLTASNWSGQTLSDGAVTLVKGDATL